MWLGCNDSPAAMKRKRSGEKSRGGNDGNVILAIGITMLVISGWWIPMLVMMVVGNLVRNHYDGEIKQGLETLARIAKEKAKGERKNARS